MGKQTRDTLKSYFQTGDVPTEGQYADLIDSHLILDETNTGILDIAGNITSSANISASSTIKGLNYQIGDRNFAINKSCGSSILITLFLGMIYGILFFVPYLIFFKTISLVNEYIDPFLI